MENRSITLVEENNDRTMNMPRVPDPKAQPKKDPSSELFQSLAINIESISKFNGVMDLDELKRKQEDLLLIQKMIQDNINGIQAKISKVDKPSDLNCTTPEPILDTSNAQLGTDMMTRTPQKLGKFKSDSKNYELSKSFNRSQLTKFRNDNPNVEKQRASMANHAIGNKEDLTPNSLISKIQSQNQFGHHGSRSRSYIETKRRLRDERKKSIETTGKLFLILENFVTFTYK